MLGYEYRIINLCDLPLKVDTIDVLDALGKDGWELVMIAPNGVAYLMREVQVDPKKPTKTD